MELKQVAHAMEQQPWLDQVDETLQGMATALLSDQGPLPQDARDFLHGTWLGHPLHPAVTDVPIGAWTAAAIFDALEMMGGEHYGQAADAAIKVGLVGAVGAAITGLTDWQYTSGRARRTGVLHALFNSTAALLYGASLLRRDTGDRRTGQALAFLGYTAMNAGAYLGGELVFSQRIGVDHSAQESLPNEFTAVMPEANLPEGELHQAQAGNAPVLLVKLDGQVYALADTCSHLGCSLAQMGKLVDRSIICQCHGSHYALDDGRVLGGPSTFPQPRLETRVQNGQIEVRLPGH